MLELIKKFWRFISFLGIEKNKELTSDDRKIRIFFNRCIFVGFFSILATLAGSIPFIGNMAYLNLINSVTIIIAFILHVKGYFNLAKRIVIYPIFAVGIYLTTISGGDYLYHTGIITVVAFSWVVFSPKKELFELILFSLIAITGYLIGELNPFNAPDFSEHPATEVTRIINLIVYTLVTLIFISFIRRLNIQYEESLSRTLQEKEALIQEVLIKTQALEAKSSVLEDEIAKRTAELLSQKEALEVKNTEKEVLLKEIHHRVKNNLQIIVSLLNLQSSKFDDKKVLEAINETQNRIISMSLVHQRMYQTADFVAVEFKEYTDLLMENIRILFSGKEKKIQHLNNISPTFKLDIETAIPLGLVINEMITNSFKHAFNGDAKSNEISIGMIENGDNSYVLMYQDNGGGFPENFDVETSQSLGLQLVTALVEQINGELKYYNDKGAVYEISFVVKA